MQHFSADLGRKRKFKLVYPQIKGKIFSFNYHDKYVENFLPIIKKKIERNSPVVKNRKSWISKVKGNHCP